MISIVTIVHYVLVVMLVDGGTISAPTYILIISTITIIQYTLIVSGILFLLLK